MPKTLLLAPLLALVLPAVAEAREEPRERPSAVYVITAEDIRRSGATTVQDALRLVPGLQVARIDASTWGVSSRGFNGAFADKLLVLVDGRRVSSPLFSGVFWDALDVVLDDVERIEVTRGPAEAGLSTNAVSGVIHVITRSSADSQGSRVSVRAGTEELREVVVSHGGELEEGVHYRVHARGFAVDDLETVGPAAGFDDDWWLGGGGLRMDWDRTATQTFSLSVGSYFGHEETPVSRPGTVPNTVAVTQEDTRLRGSYAVLAWTEALGDDSELSLQLYYDGTFRDLDDVYDEGRDTVDVELVHRFRLSPRNEIAWGLGYDWTSTLIDDSTMLTFRDLDRSDNLFRFFVRDEIVLAPERLSLTLGTELEHNDYTAFEVEPSARLLWTPDEKSAAWASVSRAVRTPTHFEHESILEAAFQDLGGNLTTIEERGDEDFESEELLAWEAGYRTSLSEDLSVDTAVFLFDYDNLATLEARNFGPDPGNPGQFIRQDFHDNQADGRALGVELAARWDASEDWRLHAGYSLLSLELDLDATSTDLTGEDAEDESPRNQAYLASAWDARHDLDVDATLFWVDELDLGVSSYMRADLRLGWRPRRDLELSLGVQNLFHDGDREFTSGFLGEAAEVETGAYLKLTWAPVVEDRSRWDLVRAD